MNDPCPHCAAPGLVYNWLCDGCRVRFVVGQPRVHRQAWYRGIERTHGRKAAEAFAARVKEYATHRAPN